MVTSVDRDDLKDMGSIIWNETIKAIRRLNPQTTLETLIPDFQGNKTNIDRIVAAAPEVVSHNVETVRRLTREVRIQAKYDQSLEVLSYLKQTGCQPNKIRELCWVWAKLKKKFLKRSTTFGNLMLML